MLVCQERDRHLSLLQTSLSCMSLSLFLSPLVQQNGTYGGTRLGGRHAQTRNVRLRRPTRCHVAVTAVTCATQARCVHEDVSPLQNTLSPKCLSASMGSPTWCPDTCFTRAAASRDKRTRLPRTFVTVQCPPLGHFALTPLSWWDQP